MRRLIFLLYFISTFLYSCNQTAEKNIDSNFVLCLFNKDESPTSFLLVESLEEEESASVQIPLSTSRIREREYIQKNGFFYRLSNQTSVFTRYQLQGSSLILLDSLQLRNPNFETVSWKDEENLLAVSREDIAERKSQARVYQINVKEMTIVREDTIILPNATDEFWALHVGLVDFAKGDLWLAYSFFKSKGKYGHTTSDTTYYATINYDSFQLKNIQKETRSTYPGGFNIIQSYSFKDKKGDYYFMTNPGIALGNNVKLPTAIFRKKKGQHLVDPTYMINISESIGNHAYGIWYVSDGKAVIRNEQKQLYTDFSNFHSVYQFEYRLVDLKTGVIEKIHFPLDKGTQKENVWSDDNYIYAAIDDSNDEHRVWKYNLQTKEVSKGIKLPNTTSYTVRLDYLK
ncbi:hypothetical protein FXV77_14655 [Sphingobacterium phlebotomi]|uniref:Uncharacterized protein n=1 Tax=Sphingobacterium phlebotomi TaxID=2605433 RepID=A0A5D4H263_9SPHI|nr:hypothetical protein [Sphingobacterium phlebotomi]TYR34708.1 hypothetical protein FXV77_14655 [Sphingobacterium phlebotomi]